MRPCEPGGVVTAPWWASEDGDVILHLGDCLDVLRTMEPGSIDAIVTDPPYGLEFMGKDWDAPWERAVGWQRATGFDAGAWGWEGPRFSARGADKTAIASIKSNSQNFQRWCELWAAECLRVLKPGGWMLAFGGTRTWHRLVCAVEDAGFEVRDGVADLTGYDAPGLMWVYGQGFPKSLDVSKAIDKAAGAEREVVGRKVVAGGVVSSAGSNFRDDNWQPDREQLLAITAPATEDAARWDGWGTALKPGWEPVCVARKPLAGTVVQNVLRHGTGALNVDGCKVEGPADNARASKGGYLGYSGGDRPDKPYAGDGGRWPPNVVLGEAAAAELDRQSGIGKTAPPGQNIGRGTLFGKGDGSRVHGDAPYYADSGGASRFYPVFRYQAKAPASERPRLDDGTAHETVKPLELIRWLCRLVTPPGGTVLDLFCGSGVTGEAAIVEGFKCILIDQDPKSAELTKLRLSKDIQPVMFGFEAS